MAFKTTGEYEVRLTIHTEQGQASIEDMKKVIEHSIHGEMVYGAEVAVIAVDKINIQEKG